MMERAVAGITDEAGSTDVWRWIRGQFGAVVRRIARTDKAFIAAINGPAAGVGLAFALTCDLAIASERALLVPAFGRLGLLPEVGTSWALTRRLGYQGAFAFFAGGRHIDAAEAKDMGLVHEVVPHDRLLAAADEWADRIAEAGAARTGDEQAVAPRQRGRKLGRGPDDGGVRRARTASRPSASRLGGRGDARIRRRLRPAAPRRHPSAPSPTILPSP